jgi:hypothetical protein
MTTTSVTTRERSVWLDGLVALGLVIVVMWWLLGTGAPRRMDDAQVDRSTLVPEDRLDDWEANHRATSFSELASYLYIEPQRLAGIPTESAFSTIPPEIRALHGQRVYVDGFMMPLDYDGGVRMFVLNASYDMCQFGAPSIPNQRIDVTMTKDRRTVYVHTPIRVFGTLEVGEEFDRGQLVSIYRMKADGIFVGY